MFTAAKSRNIIIYPMIQSLEQLYENYGQHGGKIIIDSCTNMLFGSFSPLSDSLEILSKALDNQTVQGGGFSDSGSFSRNHSQNYQMIRRPLMTPGEIAIRPRSQWIMTKTGNPPLLTILQRYDQWGIKLDKPYISQENAARPVKYADKDSLMSAVAAKCLRQVPYSMPIREPPEYTESNSQDYDDTGERIPFNEDYL